MVHGQLQLLMMLNLMVSLMVKGQLQRSTMIKLMFKLLLDNLWLLIAIAIVNPSLLSIKVIHDG